MPDNEGDNDPVEEDNPNNYTYTTETRYTPSGESYDVQVKVPVNENSGPSFEKMKEELQNLLKICPHAKKKSTFSSEIILGEEKTLATLSDKTNIEQAYKDIEQIRTARKKLYDALINYNNRAGDYTNVTNAYSELEKILKSHKIDVTPIKELGVLSPEEKLELKTKEEIEIANKNITFLKKRGINSDLFLEENPPPQTRGNLKNLVNIIERKEKLLSEIKNFTFSIEHSENSKKLESLKTKLENLNQDILSAQEKTAVDIGVINPSTTYTNLNNKFKEFVNNNFHKNLGSLNTSITDLQSKETIHKKNEVDLDRLKLQISNLKDKKKVLPKIKKPGFLARIKNYFANRDRKKAGQPEVDIMGEYKVNRAIYSDITGELSYLQNEKRDLSAKHSSSKNEYELAKNNQTKLADLNAKLEPLWKDCKTHTFITNEGKYQDPNTSSYRHGDLESEFNRSAPEITVTTPDGTSMALVHKNHKKTNPGQPGDSV